MYSKQTYPKKKNFKEIMTLGKKKRNIKVGTHFVFVYI